MKKSVLIICIVAVAFVVVFMMQRQKETALHQQNAFLRQQLEQLQSDHDRLSNSLAQAQSAPPPADSSLELARLRNQVGMLRQKTNELGKLRGQNFQPQTRTVSQNQSEPISSEDQFELDRIHAVNALRQIQLAAKTFAVNNNNQFPTNFEQMQHELGGVTNFWGVGLDSIEFMDAGLVTDEMPSAINFRQKNARQTSDGKWMRIYGLVDGSVQTKYSADGNFDDYEKEHLAPPPAQ